MRRTLRLVKREYLAAVKTKGFIIMLVLMPVIMGGSAIAMYLLRGQVDTKDKRVVIMDHSGVVKDMLLKAVEERNNAAVYDKETGKKIQPAYLLDRVEPDKNDPRAQRLQLSDRIRSGDLHAFLEIGPNVLYPKGEQDTFRIKYHAKNAAMDNVRNWLNNTINPYLRRVRLTDAGVDESKADEIMTWLQVEPMGLLSVDEETGEIQEARRTSEEEALFVPIVVFFLMFMMIMMGAMPLLQSTFEEKTQRIAEVLLGSLKPHEFMAGKVLGGLAVSLTGALVYVTGGVFFLGRLGLKDVIPYHVIPWFFAFLVLEIVMVGSWLAALGSTCNDPKDAQNLTFPAMFPVFIPMFVFMPVLMEPTSAFATWMSLFPPFTPMLMLIRKSAPAGIPAWQPWVGLVGVVLFTATAIWAGGRIFRVGILMQGGAPKLSNMIKWAIRG
ncbi:MAG: ABC transporter permease [Candidatus Aminicenantes bacterium]|nr:MAG: ABC transporter permease [Candidatus Aminicenantes bacterium]